MDSSAVAAPAVVEAGMLQVEFRRRLHNFAYDGYLDVLMVTLSLAILLFYHATLALRVKKYPHQTSIGINRRLRKAWVRRIMKDNDTKNIVAVESLRNTLMECTTMANSYVLIACASALGIFLATSVDGLEDFTRKLGPAVYGSTGSPLVLVKFGLVLGSFFAAFLCVMWAIAGFNQVNLLINVPAQITDLEMGESASICEGADQDYVVKLLCRACNLQIIGGRVSYLGFTLLAWFLGPLATIVPPIVIVLVQSHLDYLPLEPALDADSDPNIHSASGDPPSKPFNPVHKGGGNTIDSSTDFSSCEFTRFTVVYDHTDQGCKVDHFKLPVQSQCMKSEFNANHLVSAGS